MTTLTIELASLHSKLIFARMNNKNQHHMPPLNHRTVMFKFERQGDERNSGYSYIVEI
jgi:hypothetical protein